MECCPYADCNRYMSNYYKFRTYRLYGVYGYRNEAPRHYIRQVYFETKRPGLMFMLDFENHNEIGSYLQLTNSYCLVAPNNQNNLEAFFNELNRKIPVIYTEIAGCRIIGRLSIGNKNGLIVTNQITDLELQHLRNQLPDNIEIRCVEERLSALGNVVVCNDKVALIHEDLDKETEEIIADTLNVEVFRSRIGERDLVGAYCVLNSTGGLVHSQTTNKQIDELSELLELPIGAGTVNNGKDIVGSGIAVSDYCGITGMDCRPHELVLCEKLLGFNKNYIPYYTVTAPANEPWRSPDF